MQSEMRVDILTPASTAAIRDFCRKWKVVELALFGSMVRGDYRDDSDVDLLVTFAAGHGWTLYDLVDMTDELAAIFGRKIDLVVKNGLRNPIRRRAILREAEVIYAA
jgi:predicted nucleotidyltransferase